MKQIRLPFSPYNQSLVQTIITRFKDLGFVKFQFLIISLVSFCNYSLLFLNLKYGYKRYLKNLK